MNLIKSVVERPVDERENWNLRVRLLYLQP